MYLPNNYPYRAPGEETPRITRNEMDLDWAVAVPKPTEKLPNTLMAYQNSDRSRRNEPCYICGRGTDCILTVQEDPGSPNGKMAPKKAYKLNCCLRCATVHKLVQIES